MYKNNLVSVIVACYNAELFIKDCIQSIQLQTYENLEIIIVNDSSEDKSLDIITKLSKNDERIKIINNEHNLGAAKSRNIAINASSARYIAICDADDCWISDKLESQLKLFKDNIGIVTSDIVVVNESGKKLKNKKYKFLLNKSYQNFLAFPAHSTVVFDRNIVKEGIVYNSFFTPAEDYELLLRFSYKYKIANLKLTKVLYRLHSENISIKKYGELGQVGLSVLANYIHTKGCDYKKEEIVKLITKNKYEEKYAKYVEFKNNIKKFKFNNLGIQQLILFLKYIFLAYEPRKSYVKSISDHLDSND
jgi:teichuronic acid biosynthesis glycosyltransferase TuaG